MERASEDPAFFLDLAELNGRSGEWRAALSCLESAVASGQSAPLWARVRAVCEAGARQGGALAPRFEALAAGAPRPAAVPGASPVADPAVETLRQALITPDLVERLRGLLGALPAQSGLAPTALSLPVTDVLTTLLGAEGDLQTTAGVAVDVVVRVTGAEHGYLLVSGAAPTAFGRGGSPVRPPEASRGVIDEVLRTRRAIVVADALLDSRFSARESVQAVGLRSALCVPVLAAGARLVGALYLGSPSAPGRFGPRELELAERLAGLFGQALWTARRFEELGRELELARRAAPSTNGGSRLLGRSAPMLELERLLDRVAPTEHTVLIEGESGTGKELVARELHARSPRRERPFVAENMGALAEGLLEAELFGHAKGAFTGADAARPGLFQLAHGGTLFLDEVGEMSAGLQAKLLRALQEREVRPVGSAAPVPVNVRVVAATHQDLQAGVREGRFREDLYYRLGIIRVKVPPLRARLEDLPLLLERFAARAAETQGRPAPPLGKELLARLARHPWRGNVRELETFAARLVLDGPDAALDPAGADDAREGPLGIRLALDGPPLPMRDARAAFDRLYLRLVFERSQGSVKVTAASLGLNRTYVSELVKRYGLRLPAGSDDSPEA